MSHVRRAVAWSSALAVALFALSGPVFAADPASNTTAANAVGWLKTQQKPDGGFETPVFPGFETRDAALAIAEQAQTGSTWSKSEALAAVQSATIGNPATSPLDFLEHDTAVIGAGGSAAKTIVLTTAPLGLDATSFGSFGNPAGPVNLVSLMGGCAASSDPAFNGLLYILIAEKLVCGSVSATGLAAVRAAQRSDGGWNYLGHTFDTPFDTPSDNDTTAVAVEALIAGGADASDPNVKAALGFFAESQAANGAWQSFGLDDPNSTALALIGVAAAGFDPASSCWRDTVMPAAKGTAYGNPDAWLRSQQLPSGRIQSPNDQYPPISTFATSQTVEGLLRSWLPPLRAPAQTCGSPEPVVDTASPAAGGAVTVSGGGFAPSTQLSVDLHSDPVHLATITSNQDGTYSVTVVIPSTTEPGPHDVVVSGLGPNGEARSVSVAITVTAAAGSGSGSGSGSDSGSGVAPASPADTTALVAPPAPAAPVAIAPRFTG